jgi:hypothetical protein
LRAQSARKMSALMKASSQSPISLTDIFNRLTIEKYQFSPVRITQPLNR